MGETTACKVKHVQGLAESQSAVCERRMIAQEKCECITAAFLLAFCTPSKSAI